MLLRIDENREIDTSYITCAEYQLFIDEKLKVGEYCQPPHWKTNRFAPGDVNKPITGVKASDAEAFCKWLTQRYPVPGFQYRLPTLTEAHEYPAKEKQIGCWCNDVEKKEITKIEVEIAQKQQWQDNLCDSLYNDIDRAYDSVSKLVRNHDKALGKALNIVNNSVHEGKLFFNHLLTGNFAYDFVDDLNFAINRTDQLDRASYRASKLAGNRSRDLVNALLLSPLMLPAMGIVLIAIFFFCALLALVPTMVIGIWIEVVSNTTISDDVWDVTFLAFSIVFFLFFSAKSFNYIYEFTHNLLNKNNSNQHIASTTDDFVRDLDFACNLALALEKKQHRTFDIDNASTYTGNFKTIRSYLLLSYLLWDLLSNIYEKVSSDRNILQARNLTSQDCETFRVEYTSKRDDTWNIYVSFLLIDERREGKMPAWEGIRIVRERI